MNVSCGCTVDWLDSRCKLLGEAFDWWLEWNVCGAENRLRVIYLIRYIYSKLPSE